MNTASSTAYERAIVDAYAAAGQSQPITMVLQQESTETQENPTDQPILTTLYQEAQADGFKPVTLAQAVKAQQANGNTPRIIAFPGIPIANYSAAPATIDFHDRNVGMTFVAGKTAPARIFEYGKETTSIYDIGVPELTQMPTISRAVASAGTLTLQISTPIATEYGVAIWADPATLGLTGSNIYIAGHAGAVATFQLPAGTSQQTIPCSACTSTTFSYST
jgi:hypothetical protein